MTSSGIVDVQRRFSIRLALLSAGSILLGVLAWVIGKAATGVVVNVTATHFVIWGLIDIAFAALGIWVTRRGAPTKSPEELLKAKEGLARSLEFNQKLNWLWVGSGVALLGLGAWLLSQGREAGPGTLGHGVGVTIQGGLLFVFDRVFLPAVKKSIT